jgi:replicative DNA helicase
VVEVVVEVSNAVQDLAAAAETGPDGQQRTRYGLVLWDLFDKSLPDLSQTSFGEGLNRAQAMARAWRTHLTLLAQIKRGVEKRGDKRPTREDIKSSGAWEEIADQVIAVHRERVYDPDLEDDEIELGVLKQRMGAFGTWLTYGYDAPSFRVREFRESSAE